MTFGNSALAEIRKNFSTPQPGDENYSNRVVTEPFSKIS